VILVDDGLATGSTSDEEVHDILGRAGPPAP
jgi:predicted phosphoribosyltransferase